MIVAVLLLGGLLGSIPVPVEAKGSLSRIEAEFEKAIRRVTPTTVVCLPAGIEPPQIVPSASSGVVISRKGHVLSDGDVGYYVDVKPGKKPGPSDIKRADRVEIRIADPKGKGFKSYPAQVIKRDRDLDSTLIKMDKPPSGLRYLTLGDSDALQVGDFSFVMGNSFGLASEAAPTLTAGLIASLVPQADRAGGVAGGKWSHLYTSAAVNPGVNGGPLVDIHGQLIGTISSAVRFQPGQKSDDPALAYAYMGKVVPMERIRQCYRDLPEYEKVFGDESKARAKKGETAALSLVFHHTARKAYRSVVSLAIKRKEKLGLVEPARPKAVAIPRYLGPVSGVLISQDGYVLTSLYNLANISTRLGWWPAPPAAQVRHAVEQIEGITVYLPDGRPAPAKVVSYHEGINLALLKADTSAGGGAAGEGKKGETVAGGSVTSYELLTPVDQTRYESGRLVLALGNPFGAKRLADPLLTAGILAKRHEATATDRWAGQWQTDAGVTDGNCGGAAVDLHGNLFGILTIWTSTRHGRNSGIGFVIPWTQIEPVLPEMKRGRHFRLPFFGISWTRLRGADTTLLATVAKGSPAEKAGLKVGDEITAIDGIAVRTPSDVRGCLINKWAEDEVQLRVSRVGKELDLKVVLGSRE